MYGLSEQLKNAVEVLKSDCSGDVSEASITSGSELFMRFISNIRDERRDDVSVAPPLSPLLFSTHTCSIQQCLVVSNGNSLSG